MSKHDLKNFIRYLNSTADPELRLYLYEASRADRSRDGHQYTAILAAPISADLIERIVSDGRLWKLVASIRGRAFADFWYPALADPARPATAPTVETQPLEVTEEELKNIQPLAEDLAHAFIAYRMGITHATAKRNARANNSQTGSYWYGLALVIIEEMNAATDRMFPVSMPGSDLKH